MAPERTPAATPLTGHSPQMTPLRGNRNQLTLGSVP
jgi:hypothetical protein